MIGIALLLGHSSQCGMRSSQGQLEEELDELELEFHEDEHGFLQGLGLEHGLGGFGGSQGLGL